MKNLENYGVQEMNAKEMKETDGGYYQLIAAAIAIGYAIESAIEGIKEGWNNPRK